MRRRITTHLLRSIIGYLGVFLALGIMLAGTSYAADRRPPAPGRSEVPREPADPPDQPGPIADQPGPIAGDGASTIGARARSTSPVEARHGASTDVPLAGGSWTQPAGELELVAGTMVVKTPANCTGGFGNVLTLSVDGQTTTFAAAASGLGSGATTITMPFAIGTLAEPDQDTPRTLTAKFANSCTRAGEDFTVRAVQVDVLKFH